MKYIITALVLLSALISKAQLKQNLEPSDSTISQIIDSLTYLKTTAQKLNKVEPTSKKHQKDWTNYNNYFELKFRPNLNPLVDYISQKNKDLIENKFLAFLSISTGSADEELSHAFAKLFINKPDEIILKLEKLEKPNLNKYLEGSFEFYTYETPIDSSEFKLLNQKIKQLMLTQK
jgi:hypothetical protein|tara:strand:+ start:59 stop:586 length:528 start_codon:yes stop_codon:yes gene_type:complete